MTAKNKYEATAATATTAITTTGTIADGSFSVDGNNATIVEIDNSGNWPQHKVTLIGAVFSVAPDVGGGINLHLSETEVDGTATHDEALPALADDNGAKYRKWFKLNDVTSAQYAAVIIPTINIRKFKLAIEVDAGQTMSSGTVVKAEGCSLEDV